MIQKTLTYLLIALFSLSFSACNKDLTNRENKLVGVWQYTKVKESPRFGIGSTNISDEWVNNQLEFVAPNQVFFYDAETELTWEGVWLLERDTDVSTTVSGETNTDIDYVLTMSLIDPNTGDIIQTTADLGFITKQKMCIIDEQQNKTVTSRLEKF